MTQKNSFKFMIPFGILLLTGILVAGCISSESTVNSGSNGSLENQTDISPGLKYFLDIVKIPRSSGHEEQIRDYLISYAQQHNFTYIVDDVGNLIIRKGTPDITFQAHMDMVQASDYPFDFNTQTIKPIIRDGWVMGNGTNIGADDGVGVSLCLVMLDTVPDIECLFTVDEEVGFTGVDNLKPGILKGKYIINLDGETLHDLITGCAGYGQFIAEFTPSRESVSSESWHTLMVSGLLSGHSGVDIGLNRANAIKVAAEYLRSCKNISISSFIAGSATNVIPSNATVVFSGEPADQVAFMREMKAQYPNETTMNIEVTACPAPETAWTKAFTNTFINALSTVPDGVYTKNDEGVQSSANLALVRDGENGTVDTETSVRSYGNVSESLRIASSPLQKAGANISIQKPDSAWSIDEDSPILSAVSAVIEEVAGYKPKKTRTQGNLECGVLQEKYPDRPVITLGPLVLDGHTPKERFNLTEFNMMPEILEKIIVKLR